MEAEVLEKFTLNMKNTEKGHLILNSHASNSYFIIN